MLEHDDPQLETEIAADALAARDEDLMEIEIGRAKTFLEAHGYTVKKVREP